MKPCRACGSTERYKPVPGKKLGRCIPCQKKHVNNFASTYTPDPRRQTANTVKWQTKKRKSDLDYKLRGNLRCRLYSAIRKGKAGSSVKDLGCSIENLKAHLEKQFQSGMSWTNHGAWHIDHIKPLAAFDLTDRDQFLKACHFTNLQPLWAIDNIKKAAN